MGILLVPYDRVYFFPSAAGDDLRRTIDAKFGSYTPGSKPRKLVLGETYWVLPRPRRLLLFLRRRYQNAYRPVVSITVSQRDGLPRVGVLFFAPGFPLLVGSFAVAIALFGRASQWNFWTSGLLVVLVSHVICYVFYVVERNAITADLVSAFRNDEHNLSANTSPGTSGMSGPRGTRDV